MSRHNVLSFFKKPKKNTIGLGKMKRNKDHGAEKQEDCLADMD